jgi:predicted nicotinamide N-methyase
LEEHSKPRWPEAARRVEFSHGDFRLTIGLPPSAEALIDEEAFAADERLPYWADLWPASMALARHVLGWDPPPTRRRVPHQRLAPPRDVASWRQEQEGAGGPGPPDALELGCGVGLVSLVLAARGWHVLATDLEPDALSWITAAARANGRRAPMTAPLDWRAPPTNLCAPVVLAADVLYEERMARSLAPAIPHLVSPTGRFVLADPGRRWLSLFVEGLADLGWDHRELERRCEPGTAAGAAPGEVRILEFTRRLRGSLR